MIGKVWISRSRSRSRARGNGRKRERDRDREKEMGRGISRGRFRGKGNKRKKKSSCLVERLMMRIFCWWLWRLLVPAAKPGDWVSGDLKIQTF